MKINIDYDIINDLKFYLEVANINQDEFIEKLNITKVTLENILENKDYNLKSLEAIYAAIYQDGYRLNAVKSELLKEINKNLVLFHGSKFGLKEISIFNSRTTCDFGNGFYLGENYQQAVAFINEVNNSSVYLFALDLNNLNILNYDCSLEWLLTICYYRGYLKEYQNHSIIKELLKKINDADIIIAPIADNKMFYIMSLFASGDINVDVALHSLAASGLGLQYVLKSEKAISQLKVLDKFYISLPERKEFQDFYIKRSATIETKLKFSKREFKDGLYIEELFK